MLPCPKLQLSDDVEMDLILINKLSANHSVGWAKTNPIHCDFCRLCLQTMATTDLGLDFRVTFILGAWISLPTNRGVTQYAHLTPPPCFTLRRLAGEKEPVI